MAPDKIQPQYRDDDGNPWAPGKCFCDLEIAKALLDVVMEGLEELEQPICLVMLSVLKSILDVGIDFAPTGNFLKAAKAAVQGAKTFSENGLEVGSFFGNWVGPACGKQDWSFDMFGALLNMPDSMGTSTGCHKKVKADCKKPQHKPDPPKPVKPTEKVSATPAEKTTQAPTSTSNEACQLRARQANTNQGVWEGKLGDPRTTTEDCGQRKQVLITTTEKDIGYYETKITGIKCKKEWEQACYHYSWGPLVLETYCQRIQLISDNRSMMDIHKATKSMTEWTCGATANIGLDGGATATWGVAAIKSLEKKEEHWVWPWANGWVPRVLRVDAKGKPKRDKYGHEMADGCDRDEWPPRNFWPGDDVAHPKGMTQRVRFNPFQHNRGAGNLWGNFCPKHDAVSTKGNRKGKKTYYVRDNLISTVKEKVQVITGKDKTMSKFFHYQQFF